MLPGYIAGFSTWELLPGPTAQREASTDSLCKQQRKKTKQTVLSVEDKIAEVTSLPSLHSKTNRNTPTLLFNGLVAYSSA